MSALCSTFKSCFTCCYPQTLLESIRAVSAAGKGGSNTGALQKSGDDGDSRSPAQKDAKESSAGGLTFFVSLQPCSKSMLRAYMALPLD